MPTLRMASIPPPTDWKEFENMTRDAFAVKWNSPDLQKIGRQGQPQHGVDIWGPDSLGRNVGLQCKCTNTSIDIATIQQEVVKAEDFQPPVAAFYVVTTAPTDSTIQEEVRTLSVNRLNNGGFPVGIFFWEDVLRELTIDSSLFKRFYPEFAAPNEALVAVGTSDLTLMDIAFHGNRLSEYVDIVCEGSCGPDQRNNIIQITKKVELCALRLLSGEVRTELTGDMKAIADNCYRALDEDRKYWTDAKRHAARAETTIRGLEYHLEGRDLVPFKLGRLMAAWACNSSRPLSNESRADFVFAVTSLLTEDDSQRAIKMIDDHKPSPSTVLTAAPYDVFHFVRSRLGSIMRIASIDS